MKTSPDALKILIWLAQETRKSSRAYGAWRNGVSKLIKDKYWSEVAYNEPEKFQNEVNYWSRMADSAAERYSVCKTFLRKAQEQVGRKKYNPRYREWEIEPRKSLTNK